MPLSTWTIHLLRHWTILTPTYLYCTPKIFSSFVIEGKNQDLLNKVSKRYVCECICCVIIQTWAGYLTVHAFRNKAVLYYFWYFQLKVLDIHVKPIQILVQSNKILTFRLQFNLVLLSNSLPRSVVLYLFSVFFFILKMWTTYIPSDPSNLSRSSFHCSRKVIWTENSIL